MEEKIELLNRFSLTARPLGDAVQQLLQQHKCYTLLRTRPAVKKCKLDEDELYVVRQRVIEENLYELTIAAKMGKEVSVDNGL